MFKLSENGINEIKQELSRYEVKDSAIIPSLYIAQKENNGWINTEVIYALSNVMDIPESKIAEVFKFYSMFNQKPVGKYHVQVCTNISCALNDSRELANHICEELKVRFNEVSPDGRFTVSKV
ncbi:MAG: NAD(P)H-dependent oxidoreductase subunit E, partial [Proteobacteria bacterium]